MKNYFLSGLAILIPIALTVIAIVFVVDVLTNPFLTLVQYPLKYLETTFHFSVEQSHMLTEIISRVLVLIILCVLSIFVGILAKILFLKYLLQLVDHLFAKIPFIKTIFKITRDLSEQFLDSRKHIFQQTIITPFPGTNTMALGFVTGKIPESIRKAVGPLDLCVFIPSSPHPVCGFVLLAAANEVKVVDISTDDAFSFIFSCGAVNMRQQPSHQHVKNPPPHDSSP